jgi:hypothetical protein
MAMAMAMAMFGHGQDQNITDISMISNLMFDV